MVIAGPAPSARKIAPSSALRRTRRLTTWPLITSAASAVISPNTPRATASGRMVRSAFATSGALVCAPPACPRGGVTLSWPTAPSPRAASRRELQGT